MKNGLQSTFLVFFTDSFVAQHSFEPDEVEQIGSKTQMMVDLRKVCDRWALLKERDTLSLMGYFSGSPFNGSPFQSCPSNIEAWSRMGARGRPWAGSIKTLGVSMMCLGYP